MQIMRRLYTLVWYLLAPALIFRLFMKGVRLPAYRQRIFERFSVIATPVDVWIHAVSLGEVVAVTPLVELLLEQKYRVLITTMTPTGSQRVINGFGARVVHQYVPYDFPWLLRRFFQTTQPKVGIIMETELWPNLIYESKRAGVALFLMNARISDAAYKQYYLFRKFFMPLLACFHGILAQSEQDAERFLSLGAPKDTVQHVGNMKFDMHVHITDPQKYQAFKQQWGPDRVVLVAASTHDGEEELILSGFKKLQQHIEAALLILVPRHPERFKFVYDLSQRQGFRTSLRSQEQSIGTSTEVLVVDALGELLGFYSMSDYAFVGGSLVPIGGHNVLEPIALEVPVFCGPYMNNSKAICMQLQDAEAIQQLQSMELIVQGIIDLHQAPEARAQQVSRASEILEANRGSVARYMAVVDRNIKTT